MFEIEGHTFYTMGGATSHDRGPAVGDTKSVGKFWWPEELPSEDEYTEARETLERAGWEVDYVITHSAPSGIVKKINERYQTDALTDFLEEVRESLGKWRFFAEQAELAESTAEKIEKQFVLIKEL